MQTALHIVWSHRPSRAVALVFAFVSTLYGTWLARIPAVQNALGLSEAALGWALLGAPVGMVAVMPVASWMIGRWGAGRVTLGSALAFAAALSAPAWAWSGPSLAVGLGLIGVTDGVLNVSMNARANTVEAGRNAPILSTCHGFFSVGGMVGAGIGSVTAVFDVPLTAALAGVGLAGALVVWYNRTALIAGSDARSTGPTFAVPSRSLVGLALLVFCILLNEGAVSNWSAVYLRNGLGASAAVAGLGYAAFSCTMALGRFYGDRVTARFGAPAVVRGGALVATGGLAGALVVGHPVAALAGFAAMGLGYASLIPILFRTAAQMPGLAPGTSLAAVAGVGYLGLFAGPPALGGVADAWGLSWIVGVMAVVSLVVAVAAGHIVPEGEVRVPSPES
jgi:MFS family permease